MKVSINIPAFALRGIPPLAQEAERAGFHALRIGDMQSTHREMYSALTVIAANTSRAHFGPGVTNPITRHPAVAASAMATLHEFSDGRAEFAIGTGDSAVHNLGSRPAGVADLEAYIRAIRELHESGRTTYQGRPLVLDWWQGGPIPIVVSAHGPKMLRMAGRVADGVVVGIGTGERARAYAEEQISIGAREAGRDPGGIAAWYLSYLNLAPTHDVAARQSGSALAVGGNLLARSAARATIPDRLRAAFDELAQRYSYLAHAGDSTDNPNARLVDELGLRDYLAEEFGVFGQDDDVRERLRALQDGGVSRLWGAYVRSDLSDFFERWRTATAGRDAA